MLQSQLAQSTPLDIKAINTPCRHIPTNSSSIRAHACSKALIRAHTQHPMQECSHAQRQLQHQSTYHAGTLTCPKTAPASAHSNALGSAPQQAHLPTLSHMPKQQLQHLAGTLTCSNKHQSTNVHSILPCPNSSSRAQPCRYTHTPNQAPASKYITHTHARAVGTAAATAVLAAPLFRQI